MHEGTTNKETIDVEAHDHPRRQRPCAARRNVARRSVWNFEQPEIRQSAEEGSGGDAGAGPGSASSARPVREGLRVLPQGLLRNGRRRIQRSDYRGRI